MPATVFQKTDAGRDELQRRNRTLDMPSRALLILCNGRSTRAALRAQLGERADALLQGLLDRGLVEVQAPAGGVDIALPELAPTPVPPPPPPPEPSPAAEPGLAPELPASLVDLAAAKQRALTEMQRLFGPGGGDHTQALLQARDDDEFQRALLRLHDSISVYQGRKGADALVQRIRYGR
jgi:hypothetical protein